MKFMQKITLFVTMTFALFFMACGNSDTAGVISETESGKYAGIVVDANGKPVANAELIVVGKGYIAARQEPLAIETTGNDGSFELQVERFSKVFVKSSDGLCAMQTLSLDSDTLVINLSGSAFLEIKPFSFNLQVGDTICLMGTPFCERVENADASAIVEFYVPAMHLDSIVLLGNFTPKKIELQLDVLPGEHMQVNRFSQSDGVVHKLDVPKNATSNFVLPDIILPLNTKPEEKCIGFSTGDESCWITSEKSQEDSLYFAIVPYMTLDTSEIRYVYSPLEEQAGELEKPPFVVYDNLGKEFFGESSSEKTKFSFKAFTNGNKSMLVMFWLKLNSEALADSGFTFIDIDAKTAGMKIRQCTDDRRNICVRVLSGVGDVTTDTTLYGTARIMDGAWHFYAVSIYDKHLNIFADGKMIRNTDIKISPSFFESSLKMDADWIPFKSERLGEIRGFAKGVFRKEILNEDPKKKWVKIEDWFKAEYYLFKQHYGF